MKTCPNCATGWYDFYENGSWKEGYCQHCSIETKEPSTKVSNMPPPTALSQRARTNTKSTGNKKHWTEM